MKIEPGEPHEDCPNCFGTGNCSNAQFKCHCRWHRPGCALVRGKGDCDCGRPAPKRASGDAMKFCQKHWDMMRAAVEARGMTPLVAVNGQSAIENMVDELANGPKPDNFDPLMAMHWNIATNLMEKLGQSAGYLMFGGPEDPEDAIDIEQIADPALKAKYRGKTWPRCPICYANIAHEFTCRDERCALAKSDGYDACIGWSADAIKGEFDKMMTSGDPR